ncbi:MAG: proline dehydrogenase family protein [Thermoflexales bacterium]|nr:proline dehydrogenase family protein [Thermoflexales bacterium]
MLLQRTFLALSRASWAQRVVTQWPLAARAARRFVAGETLEQAIAAVRALNQKGVRATLDFLGESVTRRDEAWAAGDEYLRALDAIARHGLIANVSLKLTQFGLDIDAQFCMENVRRVVARAKELNNFVRVDMEDSAHTQATLDIVRQLHAEFGNVGAVLQAYLYRTRDDLVALADAGVRIRLCKGAYNEPPSVAFARKADVDRNYATLIPVLLARATRYPAEFGGRVPPLAAFATHDVRLIAQVQRKAAAHHVPREAFEFQMLYGVRPSLQTQLVQQGYAVRAYVPYGAHWYPYFMRRLAERPANVWFFVRSVFAR